MKYMIFFLALSAVLGGCGRPSQQAQIGIVDVARLRDHWPKFQADDAALSAEARALQRSTATPAEVARRRAALRLRFQRMQDDVTQDVRRAGEAVAKARGLSLVLTQESVGYGGVDITTEVEKQLHIRESATPRP